MCLASHARMTPTHGVTSGHAKRALDKGLPPRGLVPRLLGHGRTSDRGGAEMWAKIDDKFPDHPKILAAGPICALLHVRAICYASRYLTDGFIPQEAVSGLLGGLEHLSVTNGAMGNGTSADCRNAAEIDWPEVMIRYGLWSRCGNAVSNALGSSENGYFVHDFLDYNPSKKSVERERKQTKQRVQKWRKTRENKVSSATRRNAVSNGAPVPSRPSPVLVTSKEGKKHGTASLSRASDPGIRLVLDAFQVAYVTRYREKPLLGAKEATLGGRLLAMYGREKVLERVAAYFGSSDPFYAKTAHSFGVFYSAFNRLGQSNGDFGSLDMSGIRGFIEGDEHDEK